jgi:hypothetical protein
LGSTDIDLRLVGFGGDGGLGCREQTVARPLGAAHRPWKWSDKF